MPAKSSVSDKPTVKTKRKTLPLRNEKSKQSTSTKVTAASSSDGTSTPAEITSEQREQMVRETAYYLSEKDGFQIGKEEDYWIRAEEQVDRLLKA